MLFEIKSDLVDQGRFPFRQNFPLDRFNCKLNAQFDRKFFRNKRATFRGILLFPFQPVGTEISDPFAQFCFGRRLARGIFPAGFSCRFAVQNDICICRLKVVLNSVYISSNKKSNKLLLWPQSQNYLAFGQSFTFFVEIVVKYRAVLQRPFCWIFGSHEQREPFHLTRDVSGISNRQFCVNGKRPRY